jgi:acyl-CoA-binding protein
MAARLTSQISRRIFSTSCLNRDVFEEAQKKLIRLKKEPEPMEKLRLYGLYKQSTVGSILGERPSGDADIAKTAKWDAWSQCSDMNPDTAREAYLKLTTQLVDKYGVYEVNADNNAKTVLSEFHDDSGIRILTLNRPLRYNAVNGELLIDLTEALEVITVN